MWELFQEPLSQFPPGINMWTVSGYIVCIMTCNPWGLYIYTFTFLISQFCPHCDLISMCKVGTRGWRPCPKTCRAPGQSPGPIGAQFAVLNVIDCSNTNFVAAATCTVQFHSHCKLVVCMCHRLCLCFRWLYIMGDLAHPSQKTLISKLDEGWTSTWWWGWWSSIPLSQTWQLYILPHLRNTGKKFELSDTVVRALLSHNRAIKFVLFIN